MMGIMFDNEYISKKNGKYLIKRNFDGVEYFFGEFSTFEEAISKIDWLDSHGWPVSIEVLEKVNSFNSSKNEEKSVNVNLSNFSERDDVVYDPLKFNCNSLNKSYNNDILKLAEGIDFIDEDLRIPFPQSDDLNRFIFIGQHLLEKDLNKEEIKQLNQIGNRIVNMYTSTGFYFHVFEKYKKDNKIFYKLSDKGKYIFSLNEYDRNLNICKCILEHEIFYRIFRECLVEKIVSKDNIINIMLQYDLNLNSMVTIKRRASCVSSWMHWIFRLMRIDI